MGPVHDKASFADDEKPKKDPKGDSKTISETKRRSLGRVGLNALGVVGGLSITTMGLIYLGRALGFDADGIDLNDIAQASTAGTGGDVIPPPPATPFEQVIDPATVKPARPDEVAAAAAAATQEAVSGLSADIVGKYELNDGDGITQAIMKLKAATPDELEPQWLKDINTGADAAAWAEKHDLYNPDNVNDSVIMHKGDTLSLDKSGSLSIQTASGTFETLSDGQGRWDTSNVLASREFSDTVPERGSPVVPGAAAASPETAVAPEILADKDAQPGETATAPAAEAASTEKTKAGGEWFNGRWFPDGETPSAETVVPAPELSDVGRATLVDRIDVAFGVEINDHILAGTGVEELGRAITGLDNPSVASIMDRSAVESWPMGSPEREDAERLYTFFKQSENTIGDQSQNQESLRDFFRSIDIKV